MSKVGRKEGTGKYPKYIGFRVSEETFETLTSMRNYAEYIRDQLDNELLKGLYDIMTNKMIPIAKLDSRERELIKKIKEVISNE